MTPEKYFIVAPDLVAYDRVIRARQLDPGRCFYCLTEAEAAHDLAINARLGIPAVIVHDRTPRPPQPTTPAASTVDAAQTTGAMQ